MDGSQVFDSTSVVDLEARAESVRNMRTDSVNGSKSKLQWDLVYYEWRKMNDCAYASELFVRKIYSKDVNHE